MSLLGLGIGMMLTSFQTRDIFLSLIAALYMIVRYFCLFHKFITSVRFANVFDVVDVVGSC